MNGSFVRGGGAVRLHHRMRASHGMVTAEFAVTLLAVIPLVLGLVALVALGATQVRLQEAARTGARLVARGESEAAARQVVREILPGVNVFVDSGNDAVAITVRQRVGGVAALPSLTLQASAVTPVEHE